MLLRESMYHLDVKAASVILDCTLGAGGHSEACLARGARVVGVDRDPAALARAGERLAPYGERFVCARGDYLSVVRGVHKRGERFDGILADLGFASPQLAGEEGRGMGLRSEAPADMRFDPEAPRTALDVIDACEPDELADLIYRYGEERRSRRIARAIKAARDRGESSCRELAEAVRRAVPGRHAHHPARRTFQALRIAVNDELGQLDGLLELAPDLLAPDGTVVVISFHSLEDRRVKQAFRAGMATGAYVAAAKKVVRPSAAEVAANPRARSAKLRWARRPGGAT